MPHLRDVRENPHHQPPVEPPDDDSRSGRQIAEASRAIGVSPRVLRYWEELGVIRPTRGPGGRRHFTRHDLLAMALMRSLQEESGVSVGELRLLREATEREVAAAMRDPLLRLRLLFLRQAAEPRLRDLVDLHVPGPPPPPRPPHDRPPEV